MLNSSFMIKRTVIITSLVWLILSPLIWISLHFNTYSGDLTRIGQWRETDFGGRISQETIPPANLISSPLNQADILVIGDSFSDPLIWQSVLIEQGWKVSTLSWSDVGDLCENFSSTLKSSGFKGRHIIFESVERVTSRQLNRSLNCRTKVNQLNNIPIKLARQPATQTELSDTLNIQGQFWAGFKTLYHSIALRTSDQYYLFHNWKSKSTQLHPISNGCEYFSHRLCKFGLFFFEDYHQLELNNDDLTIIHELNKRVDVYKVMWLIIPNKSSIYQREINEDFWMRLDQEQLGPNLLGFFKKQKEMTKDLYAPNDSHLSINGYRKLGHLISHRLNK